MDIKPYQQFADDQFGGFNDIELLITAFTHRSYINEHKKSASGHNERLEFLGDAVLELVVTEDLYRNFEEAEGVLTNWRSALVRTESIGAAAAELDFEPLLRLSRGEKRGSDRARQQILANSYEAVIGALYIDQGLEAARKFIEKTLMPSLKNILEKGLWLDPKSRLQEMAQSQDNATPIYRVLNEDGPDHDKTFVVGVFVQDQQKGQGVGPSKQAAQVLAAADALNHYTDN
jgi:ribonuclease-3